jgi:hypothetical protein
MQKMPLKKTMLDFLVMLSGNNSLVCLSHHFLDALHWQFYLLTHFRPGPS